MPNGETTPDLTSQRFPSTRWTIVCAARGQSREARQALDELCRLYWPAVYGFIRRKGRAPADAEDLTQGFFAELLERGSLDGVAAEKGRLRTFLLKAVTRHMINQHEKASAAKRGGGIPTIPLDTAWAEDRFSAEPGHGVTPDIEFQRQWALRLLQQAFQTVKIEAGASGREALFDDLKGLISLETATAPYEEIGKKHGLSEGAVKVAAHRLRQKFREALRALIADTVEDETEIDDEIRYLFSVFQSP